MRKQAPFPFLHSKESSACQPCLNLSQTLEGLGTMSRGGADWAKLCVSDLCYQDSRQPRKLVTVVNQPGSRMTKETNTWAYI